jgi:hypothetical protein
MIRINTELLSEIYSSKRKQRWSVEGEGTVFPISHHSFTFPQLLLRPELRFPKQLTVAARGKSIL